MDIEKLDSITIATLTDICDQYFHLSRQDYRLRARVYAAISLQPIAVQRNINSDTNEAIESGLTKHRKKDQKPDQDQRPSKRQRLSTGAENQDDPMTTIPLPALHLRQPDNQEDPHPGNESNGENIVPYNKACSDDRNF